MEASLRKEKNKLQEELSTASKELQDLQDFESIVSELDTSQPASNDEDEVMVSQSSERVQNMKKDIRKKTNLDVFGVFYMYVI